MTQLTRHPSSASIEDLLDAVGQKDRLLRVTRGAMLWAVWATAAIVVACLAADRLGQGRGAMLLAIALAVAVIAAGGYWILRPLAARPRPLHVARMVEQRLAGLHDGLTNALLLARSHDLAGNPWLGEVFDEVWASCRLHHPERTVRFADLKPLALRLAGPAALVILLAALFPARLAHGWNQMLAPASFVPAAGAERILSVRPGDVTLAAGQPLEITATVAAAASTPNTARLIFDGARPSVDLSGTPAEPGTFDYSYRLEHVDAPLRYRIEAAGSQSQWYQVRIVSKVSLTDLDVKITPPLYTRQPMRTLALTLGGPEIIAPLGSRMEISAGIDVAAKGAVLLLNSQSPLTMTPAQQNRRFFGDFVLSGQTSLYVGITGGERIIAKLPDNGLSIRPTPDAPPLVTMQWPAQDLTMAPTTDLTILAQLRDDYGLSSARLLIGFGDDEPTPWPGTEQSFAGQPTEQSVQFPLKFTADQVRPDSSITLQVEATDNRDLTALSSELGPQSARGPKVVIRFQDAQKTAQEQSEQIAALSARLQELLRAQQGLHDKTISLLASLIDRDAMARVSTGQAGLRALMRQTTATFRFSEQTRVVQKTLDILAAGPAGSAVDLANQIVAEPLPAEQLRQGRSLTTTQQTILQTLQSLLANLAAAQPPGLEPPSPTGKNPAARADAFKKLDDALKQYEKEQQRILNQTAPLAKKPVDNYDEKDKNDLAALKLAQDKLDAFMQETLADFSKNDEQDMSNPSVVKDLMSIYSQTTMAKDALEQKSIETAVPMEEMGLESAAELRSNIEKWLDNQPDRIALKLEDPTAQQDTPLAELPKEMQDMIGDLLEQQEDLNEKMEDANANWHDSIDKGIGWQAHDGPVSDDSAKGITGNQLPNNNEMQGRGGEGRNGKAMGEFVGDTASGKGGRNTPTRLEPTPFQTGQIKDTSKNSGGGATGGGKKSGAGAGGLEGPVPPQLQRQMQRLTNLQAQIRNAAERLNLQYKLGRYDNFKLLQGIVAMRRLESDLSANRYQNALRRTDEVVNDLQSSAILLGGRMSVDQDTTLLPTLKRRKEIEDAEQGDLPAVWSQSLREYYRKLAEE